QGSLPGHPGFIDGGVASHTLTAPPPPALTSRRPLGVKAMPRTGSGWPVSASVSRPVLASHTRTVPSALAVPSLAPSGPNATPRAGAGVPPKGGGPPRGAGPPPLPPPVLGAARQPTAVRAEGQAADPVPVAAQGGDLFPRGRLPHPDLRGFPRARGRG